MNEAEFWDSLAADVSARVAEYYGATDGGLRPYVDAGLEYLKIVSELDFSIRMTGAMPNDYRISGKVELV